MCFIKALVMSPYILLWWADFCFFHGNVINLPYELLVLIFKKVCEMRFEVFWNIKMTVHELCFFIVRKYFEYIILDSSNRWNSRVAVAFQQLIHKSVKLKVKCKTANKASLYRRFTTAKCIWAFVIQSLDKPLEMRSKKRDER